MIAIVKLLRVITARGIENHNTMDDFGIRVACLYGQRSIQGSQVVRITFYIVQDINMYK
jgi:hypothetical protein